MNINDFSKKLMPKIHKKLKTQNSINSNGSQYNNLAGDESIYSGNKDNTEGIEN